MLDDRALDMKAFGFAIGMVMGVALFDLFACLADKKLRQMTAMAVVASDKGINRLDAMNETKFGEKIQGAVNRWRLRRANFWAQAIQQVISFNGPAILNDQLKYMGA